MSKESLANLEVKSGDLADLFGITERWVRDLAREGVIPKTGTNKYVLGDAVKGYLNFLKEQAEKAKRAPVADLDAESTRLKRAQADKTELEVAMLHGQIVRWEDVLVVLSDMVNNFKTRTLAIPAKSAPILSSCSEPAQVQAILKKLLTEALNECSRYDPEEIVNKVISRTGKLGGAAA